MDFRILVFTTKCCVNCKQTKLALEAACDKKGIEVLQIDLSEADDGAIQLWGLKQVPTLIAVKVHKNGENGEEIDRRTGAQTPFSINEFLLHIERTLKEANERDSTS